MPEGFVTDMFIMSFHISILCYLVYIASMRGGLVPFKITFVYTLFVVVGLIAYLLRQFVGLMFELELLFKFMLVIVLYDMAEPYRQVKKINRFCWCMIIYMGILVFGYLAYWRSATMTDQLYAFNAFIFNASSIVMSAYVIYVLLGVIDGTRNSNILSRISRFLSRFIYAFTAVKTSYKKTLGSMEEHKKISKTQW